MADYLEGASDFLANYDGKILIVAGIAFLVLGLLFMSQVASPYYWASALGFLLGPVLLVAGFLMETEFASSGFAGKLGSIFLLASSAFLGGFFVAAMYRVITEITYQAIIFHGHIEGYAQVYHTDNPFAWLASPLLIVGACLLISGLVAKIFSEAS